MASNVTRTTRRDGIQFGANGYLSLADNEIDVSSGNLTLDVAGNCIINADGGNFAFKDDSKLALTLSSTATYTELLLNERGGTTVDDYFRIRCNEHGSTDIITKDGAATAGHITLAPDGNLVLDPVSQKVIINTGDQLYFDGGTHTYIEETSDDTLSVVVGTSEMLKLEENGGNSIVHVLDSAFKIKSGMPLFLDGGNVYSSDSYLWERGADNVQLIVGDWLMFAAIEDGATNGSIFSFEQTGVGWMQFEPTYNATDTEVYFNRNGNKAFLTFGSGNIADLNLYFPNVSCNCVLVIKQDGTGSREVAADGWITTDQAGGNASTVKWAGGSAPTLSTGANAVDIISFYWDNDNHTAYGVASLNFS